MKGVPVCVREREESEEMGEQRTCLYVTVCERERNGGGSKGGGESYGMGEWRACVCVQESGGEGEIKGGKSRRHISNTRES